MATPYRACGNETDRLPRKQRRTQSARDDCDRLSLRNDVGLLSEEYDPRAKRLMGNFPQAFSHVALVNTAFNLGHDNGQGAPKPAEQRGKDRRRQAR